MNPVSAPHKHPPSVQALLCLGALGVVFGDIGTSPLYTVRECLSHVPAATRMTDVVSLLSLMFWSLVFVVGWKYLFFVTRADNRGEGGIFALLALSSKFDPRANRSLLGVSTVVVLVGAALLYGDGIITPAISVLSACEGLVTFSEKFTPFVVPIAVMVLAALFLLQSRGTEAIGKLFGPVMLVWFGTLAGLGVWRILAAPQVLRALDPRLGLGLVARDPLHSTALLGAVVLTFTGAEALYADMGHFGRTYIARAWNFVVFPSLVLNYFGQGAYVLSHPFDDTNPFFALAPEGPFRLGLVVLSMAATVIASQALISGTYSLTQQAIQLGFFPRLKILHTNPDQPGQIYVPFVNSCLAVGAIWIVLDFGSSSKLASAYGIAVTGTMLVTAFAFYRVTRLQWKWKLWQAVSLTSTFVVFDAVFFLANLRKITDGGWLPLAVGTGMLVIMITWQSGRSEIQRQVYSGITDDLELSSVARSKNIVRISGCAVFMVGMPRGTPLALLHHLKANKSLQKTVVLLTILTEDVPFVAEEARLAVESLGEGVWRAIGHYGYMETPDVTSLIEEVRRRDVPLNPNSTTYYFNREMILMGGNARMLEWQKKLYAFLSRNAQPVKDYYRISPTQIIEIGLPVQL